MAEYGEEIYETNGINEDSCSLVDEGYWYENDLLLAAELGKTLLARNRDLESQLNFQTKNSNNSKMEIDLLKKQLETLRELNRNKMILYEDVDRNSHDLELVNRNLSQENKKTKERIQNLSKKNVYLEQQIDDCQERLAASEQMVEELKKAINLQSSKDPWESDLIMQRTQEICDNAIKERQLICPMCKELKERIAYLDIDLDQKTQENEESQQKIAELQRKWRLAEVELEDAKCFPQQNEHKKCQPETLVDDLYSALEYDIDRVDDRPIEVGSLDTGGKVFTSTKSLKCIGAEAAKPNVPSSLLTELDDKYNNLVRQYESLLQQSSSTPSQRSPDPRSCDHCASGSTANIADDGFQKRLDNIFSEETRQQRKSLITQNYRPKYKELFRDAFSLLKDMKQNKRPEDGRSRPCLIDMKQLSSAGGDHRS